MGKSSVRKLVVFGGNGFLGKRICQIALQSGIFRSIVSLSRSGQQPLSTHTEIQRYPHQWMRSIHWEKADIFDPNSYKHHLSDATDVVHSIGVILESSSYKSIMNGYSPNQRKLTTKEDFSYRRMNTESATILAKAFQNILSKKRDKNSTVSPTSNSFTYISAENWSSLIPSGYIESKREAEWELSHLEPEVFRSIFVRPGIMYDENSKHSFTIRNGIIDAIGILDCANNKIFQRKFEFLNNAIKPATSTQQVARTVISRIEDAEFKGIITLTDIQKGN